MRRFLQDIELHMMDFPDEHKQFQCLLSATATQTGTLGEMLNEEQSETIVPLPPVKMMMIIPNLQKCIKLCFPTVR